MKYTHNLNKVIPTLGRSGVTWTRNSMLGLRIGEFQRSLYAINICQPQFINLNGLISIRLKVSLLEHDIQK